MHYIQSVLKLKHRMSKFAGLRNPSAGFRKLLAVLMLIVLSENRCGFFISLFLFLSLMRQASITRLTILSFSNIRLSRRPHLTRPPLLSLLYVVENIWSINIKECFFSPGQWSKISRATRLTRLPHSKNEMQHQSKTDPPKAELLAMIFTSDYLQLDLFKYAWRISKHECTHIK